MKYLILLLIALITLDAQSADLSKFDKINFKKLYGKYKGSFVIKKDGEAKLYINNKKMANTRYSPCSTFKIPNSLIGLETGVLQDENTVIKWDSVKRFIDEWNRDNNLRSAIKYSVVPYYQELARRVGTVKMKNFVDKINYGNNDISGGIDKFWLVSSLKISAVEQVEFIEKLYNYKLPFSKRSIDIVKSIIIQDSTDKYIFSGKTGSKDDFGWFVGSITENGERYYFAINIAGKGAMGPKAKPILIEILKELGFMRE